MNDLILPGAQVLIGDCITRMKELQDKSAQMCVTSPPYFGLRDYGHDGQIGLEQSPAEFVSKLVDVFREVRRVLADDGTLWINIGDSYGKGKQLLMVPARLAIALQDDGWVLRQDIVWNKPNAMPQPVTDRCTTSHEYLFLLAKKQKYLFNSEAFQEPAVQAGRVRADRIGGNKHTGATTMHSDGSVFTGSDTRNRRSVWNINTRPFKGAHFAVFPPDLVEPCILAGSRPGDTVLDPFNGSGTTGAVAIQHGRQYVGTELNPDYIHVANDRLAAAIKARDEAEAKASAAVAQADLFAA
jgi:DNA modification methylase